MAEVAAACEQSRRAGQTVIQAHGTFDLLHLGHVRHLEAARKLGDVLIVTVTADRFVNKGPGRPVFNAELRAEMLEMCIRDSSITVLTKAPTSYTICDIRFRAIFTA